MTKTSVAVDARWKTLYRIGAIAALVAALGFRRNMGAEMTMFFGAAPKTAVAWFTLLQNNSLLGIISLNFFDIIDYALVGIMFVALYFAFRKTSRIFAAAATSMCLAGITVYIVFKHVIQNAFPQQPIHLRLDRHAENRFADSCTNSACKRYPRRWLPRHRWHSKHVSHCHCCLFNICRNPSEQNLL